VGVHVVLEPYGTNGGLVRYLTQLRDPFGALVPRLFVAPREEAGRESIAQFLEAETVKEVLLISQVGLEGAEQFGEVVLLLLKLPFVLDSVGQDFVDETANLKGDVLVEVNICFEALLLADTEALEHVVDPLFLHQQIGFVHVELDILPLYVGQPGLERSGMGVEGFAHFLEAVQVLVKLGLHVCP